MIIRWWINISTTNQFGNYTSHKGLEHLYKQPLSASVNSMYVLSSIQSCRQLNTTERLRILIRERPTKYRNSLRIRQMKLTKPIYYQRNLYQRWPIHTKELKLLSRYLDNTQRQLSDDNPTTLTKTAKLINNIDEIYPQQRNLSTIPTTYTNNGIETFQQHRRYLSTTLLDNNILYEQQQPKRM